MSNNELTTQNKPATVAQYLNNAGVKKYLDGVLKERAPQFITSLTSLANLTPGLAKCDPNTLLQCGLKAASMNLPLDNNLGFAYAVPYGDKAQFQMGYRGFIQLAQRTGQYKMINVIDIRAGELVSWDEFGEVLEISTIKDKEARQKQAVVAYAAMFELMNGFRKVVFWTKEEVTLHAKRFSKTFNNGPWKTDFDAMAKKTVLKDLLGKWGPMSTEMQEAVKFDQSIIKKTEDGAEIPEYVDAQFSVVDEAPKSFGADSAEEEFRRMKSENDGGHG
ncbi:MAG: recombinase RecT [Clostridia bacterium]|nr:recombinase RecT [Clostridia bacterium]